MFGSTTQTSIFSPGLGKKSLRVWVWRGFRLFILPGAPKYLVANLLFGM